MTTIPLPPRRPRVKIEVEFTLFDASVDPDVLRDAVFDILGNAIDIPDVSVDHAEVTDVRE